MAYGFHEKPYPDDRQAAHVVASRTAARWLPDIAAYLVEQELTAELAQMVAGYMDVTGMSMQRAVADIKSVLKPPVSGVGE